MPEPRLHPIVAEDLAVIAAEPLPWDRLAGKSVLVTGAAGFLPAYMVETLLHLNRSKRLGCKVVGLVRNMEKARRRFAPYLSQSDLELTEGDVATDRKWPARFDVVVHAASQASPKFYGSDPVGTMSANLLGTHHLLRHAADWKSQAFLFFSSGEVYGRTEKVPTSEADYGFIEITDPRSCYAEGKRAAETLGVSFARQFNVPFCSVRPFHTYGPGMSLDDGRIYADLVRDVLAGRDLVLHSDGQAVRAFCYLSDAARGFFTVLLKGVSGTAYNVGNPDGTMSIRNLAKLLADMGSAAPLRVSFAGKPPQGYLPSPIAVNVPDISRMRALGWSPTLLPADGFARTLRFFRES
jgi:UDP-glucuronate decarboxylase